MGAAARQLVNDRVQAATNRAVESCNRVARIADGMLEEMDDQDLTPVVGIPLQELDEEDSAVIAITEVIDHKTIEQKAIAAPARSRRLRTEPGIG